MVGFGVFGSSDGGRAWQRLSGRVPGDVMSLVSASLGRMVYAFAVDPVNRSTIYAGADGGLFKSTDGGTAWQKLPFPGSNALVVGVSRAQPGRVMAITGSGQDGIVERSDDGGATWARRQ